MMGVETAALPLSFLCSQGHIGSVSMSLTKAWGPEMNAWLPTEDEIRAGEPREPRVAPKTVERRLKQVGG
jgi:hypothetical protein